jgi:FixJ family two-component response regulator
VKTANAFGNLRQSHSALLRPKVATGLIDYLVPGRLYIVILPCDGAICVFQPSREPSGYVGEILSPAQLASVVGSASSTRIPRHCRLEFWKQPFLKFTVSPSPDRIDRILGELSLDERPVLDGIVRGLSNIDIGKELGVDKDKVGQQVRNLAIKSGLPTLNPQIALAIMFCRLAPRAVCNHQAFELLESWNDGKKECLVGVMNDRSTAQMAAAVGLEMETVRRYLSDMMQEQKAQKYPPDPDINTNDGTRLRLVAWYISNFFPAIERLNVESLELEGWSFEFRSNFRTTSSRRRQR